MTDLLERPEVLRDPPPLLRALVDLRDRQVQKARIQWGNRYAALSKGTDEASQQQAKLVGEYLSVFEDLEHKIDGDLRRIVKREPIYPALSGIRGIGPTLAAKLIALIDISNKENTSQLWRFCGYAVIDGHAEKLVAGEKTHYSTRLKTTLYLVAESFIKLDSPYRRVYDEAKPRLAATHSDWTPMHIHRAAIRIMIKLFLSHLWLRWRTVLYLPITEPYVKAYLGHNAHHRPEDFGW